MVKVTRRDFLNGMAVGVASVSLVPFNNVAFATTTEALTTFTYYPPAQMGLRGSHPGSFEMAHRLMRGEEPFELPTKVEEHYDLIIVGAGISGLAAAVLYRQKNGPNKKILLLDNHEDFGGHATRNEFATPNGLMIGYGGSESFQSPRTIFSPVATKFLKDMGIALDKLESYFDVNFYPDLGLSKGVYFDKANFGVDKVVVGDPGYEVADDIPRDKLNGRPYKEFIADFPLAREEIDNLIELHEETVDYLAQMSLEEKQDYLAQTSYSDFLRDKVQLTEQAMRYFQQQTSDFQGVGIDATPCSDARLCALPGFGAMNLPPLEPELQAELDDPYIFHFPDGNASLTRLMVRQLIPQVAQGATMEDVVLAKFDYQKLDQPETSTRLRLSSTVINVENKPDHSVDVVYVSGEQLRRINGQQVIMANYNMMIPYMIPTMPQTQRDALAENVKVPLVYAKVVLTNWRVFKKLGIHKVYSPTAPFSLIKLDYPVSMGGYQHSQSPDNPVCLHMVYVPIMAGSGKSPKEQSREGRKTLVKMPFEAYEALIRTQLDGMFKAHGFNHQEEIIGITVNRWAHGYSYTPNTLFDDEEKCAAIMLKARQPFGNIYIANSDSEWSPYAHSAIDAAQRVVEEMSEKA